MHNNENFFFFFFFFFFTKSDKRPFPTCFEPYYESETISAKFLLRKLVFNHSANKPQVYIHSREFFRGLLVLFEGKLRFKMGGFHNKTAFNTKLADIKNYSDSPLANTEY